MGYGLYGINGGFDLILYLAAAALVLIAQSRIQAAYSKYSRINNVQGVTGADTAKRILAANNINDVEVRVAPGGTLNDHYDPRNKTVNLSEAVYRDTSIASVSVAAHEVGHAIQHHVGYKYLAIRNMITPLASTASTLSFPILIMGMFMNISFLFTLGIILFFAAAAFQLITLPVEFNASSRALKLLQSENILMPAEMGDAKNMLMAAAFTYVAGLGSTIIQIIRMISINNRNNR